MWGLSRRGCGCLGGFIALIVLVVWFAIALNTVPVPVIKPGFEGVLQAIAYALIWTPRAIAGVFGYKSV